MTSDAKFQIFFDYLKTKIEGDDNAGNVGFMCMILAVYTANVGALKQG